MNNARQAKTARGATARVLAFPTAPATVQPQPVKRDGYGRPITHMFGLRISGTVTLTRPFEMRRSGGVVEIAQAFRGGMA